MAGKITIAVAVFLAGIVGMIVVVCVGIGRRSRSSAPGLVSMTRRAPGLFGDTCLPLMGLYVGQRTDLEPAAVRYRDRAVSGRASRGTGEPGPREGIRAAPLLGHGAARIAVGAI